MSGMRTFLACATRPKLNAFLRIKARSLTQETTPASVPPKLQDTFSKDYQPPMPDHIKSIVDSIAQLKFYEISLLNECLRKTLNIPDAPMLMTTQMANAAGEDDGVQSAGVKTEFTVKLIKFDETKKVTLIKEIKKLVEGINLVEAKRFVEDCPKVIRGNLSKDEAESLKKQLEEAGGVVTVD